MISRLQPHASSVEAGSNGKPHHNLMRISAKQNFSSDYHYLIFGLVSEFQPQVASMEAGAGGG